MKKRLDRKTSSTNVRQMSARPGATVLRTMRSDDVQCGTTIPLNPDTALVIGRRLGNDQLSRRQVAGLFQALLRCESTIATKQILRNLLEGIALADPDARHSVDEFIVEVTGLRDLQDAIRGL
jgi:hypothetical protein